MPQNRKNVWQRKEMAVSPVIATILMVAVTVVLSGVLVLYMQNVSNAPAKQAPYAVLTSTFTPQDPKWDTTNSGVWKVSIQSIDHVFPWADVDIYLYDDSNIVIASCSGNAAKNPYSETTLGVNLGVKFTICETTPGAAKYDPDPLVSGTVPSALNSALGREDLMTLQNVTFLVVDNNADTKLSPSDSIYVFRCNNGDGIPEILDDSQIILKTANLNMGKQVLTT